MKHWTEIKWKPPENVDILVVWRDIHGELRQSVSHRNRIPRHCFENPPVDDRYWIGGMEIKPLYWQFLPELPKIIQNEKN